MNRLAPRGVTDALLCAGVGVAAFAYRFNTLGGAFGGFTNDEFGYLARARQIQAGELPFRDFNDPGWFLTDSLSALAQMIGGYNLRSQALLTAGMLAIAAVLTFLVARRAAGSAAAVMAAAFQVALEPRHYNYPKVLFCAAALVLAWRYADSPSRLRLWALGALVGTAFLFRHDYIVYLGAFSAMTIAMVHWREPMTAVRAGVNLAAAASVFVVPFLLFLSLNGGTGEYFRAALVYVQRDAERTSFRLPTFAIDPGTPLIAVTREPEMEVARINVRWSTTDHAVREERESRYHLAAGQALDELTSTYELRNASRTNIESLVRDPLVDDTHGIDRANFSVETPPRPLRVTSPLDSAGNATAFLYYGFVLLPVAAAAVLLRVSRSRAEIGSLASASHLVPLIVLAAMLNLGFMSRGSTNIRVPDVGVTSAVLLFWLVSVILSRDGRAVVPWRLPRVGARAAMMAVLGLTLLSVETLGQVSRDLPESGLLPGGVGVLERAAAVSEALGTRPNALNENDDQPRVLRLAEYVRRCTVPSDRLFVLGEHPELYYFSDRLIAGGHAWLLPRYYSDDADEARIVSRLRSVRVPIVVTEDAGSYNNDYRPVFEQVDAYLRQHYVPAGVIEIDGGSLQVLVHREVPVSGRYEPLGLPCPASEDTVAAR